MADEPVPAIIQQLQRRIEALEKLTDEMVNSSGGLLALSVCPACGMRAIRRDGQWVEIHLTTCPNARLRDTEQEVLRGNRP